MTEEFDFENDRLIDLDNLHMEWATQGQKRYKYAKHVSYLEKLKEKAHERLKVKRSQLIRNANKDPQGCCDNPKPTAPLIEAYYRTHPEYIKTKDDFIDATYELSMAWNALKEIDDKKTALENEVSLWKGNYFATPREHRDIESGKIMDKKPDVTKTIRTETNKRRRIRN